MTIDVARAREANQEKLVKQLQIAYYRRARMLSVTPADTEGAAIGAPTLLPLAALFKSADIPWDEIEAAARDAGAYEKQHERMDAEFNPEFDKIRENGIRALAMHPEFEGSTVLDVGGYSGEFAKLALDLGAAQAVVYDSGEFADYGWVRPVVPEGVIYQRGNLMDFGWRAPQPADFTIFYNVLYHIRDPWTALERMRLLTTQRMALCTSFVPGDSASFALFGYDDENERAINDVYTVFWRPTIPGMLKLLRLVGFREISEPMVAGDHVVVTAGV